MSELSRETQEGLQALAEQGRHAKAEREKARADAYMAELTEDDRDTVKRAATYCKMSVHDYLYWNGKLPAE